MPSFADFVTGKYTIVTVSETAFYQSLADPVRWDGYISSSVVQEVMYKLYVDIKSRLLDHPLPLLAPT